MSNFSRIRAENQVVFFNTTLVYGINSIDITENFGADAIKYVGIGYKPINQSVNQAQYVDLNINSLLIQEDVFIEQSGLVPINCFILPNLQNVPSNPYVLISGYLTHYSAKYVPNQPAQLNSSFRFYNNAGNINTGNLDPYASGQLFAIMSSPIASFNQEVSDGNYINLSINEYQTNRVLDYTFSLDMNRLPIYNIGTRFPKRIELIYPINVTCDVTFEADEAFSDVSLTDFPLNKTVQNINLGVYSNRTNLLIADYLFQNMTLVSNSKQSTTDNNVTITRKYVGQLFTVTTPTTPQAIVWDFGVVFSGAGYFIDWGLVTSAPTSGNDFGGVS